MHDGFIIAGFLWALYAIIPAFLTLPIVVWSRRRVRWYPWELLAFIVPFGVWLALSWSRFDPSLPKGINNLIESLYVGLGIPATALIRVATGPASGKHEKMFAAILLLLLCGLAAAIYFFTPDLEGSLGC